MKRGPILSHAELLAAAPAGERWIPMTHNGTLLHDRENGSTGFASVTPEGAARFRRMFRLMARRALVARGGLEALSNAEKANVHRRKAGT